MGRRRWLQRIAEGTALALVVGAAVAGVVTGSWTPGPVFHVVLLAALMPVLIEGLRRTRSRPWAYATLFVVPLRVALDEWMARVAPDVLVSAWSAVGPLAVAAACAHGSRAVTAALPERFTSARHPFAVLGAVAIGLVPLAPLVVLVAVGWAAAAWLGRARRVRETRGERIGCVRFPCPRCGVDQDFARPLSPCTSCGLFVRVDWGGPREAEVAGEAPLRRATARFGCPYCGADGTWPHGASRCGTCGVEVRLAWNWGGAHGPATTS